jgi:2-dehydro-3-deoxygluconokinase
MSGVRACPRDRDQQSVAADTAASPLAFIGEGLIEITLDEDGEALDYGGDAANAAAMSARLGAPAQLFGRVGADPLGQRLLAFWRTVGVDVSEVVVDRTAATGLYVNDLSAPTEGGMPRFTYWRRGSAGSRWSLADVTDSALRVELAALIVTGITVTVSDSCANGVWELVRRARSRSIVVVCILNHRAALEPDAETLTRLALSSDVVIASMDDLRATYPTYAPVEVFDLLRGRELVLTAGRDGASVIYGNRRVHQPAPSAHARSTAGAGDALAGAYLAARFHRHESPAEALAWGVAASSLSVERTGCASSYPDATATAAARAALPDGVESATLEAVGYVDSSDVSAL